METQINLDFLKESLQFHFSNNDFQINGFELKPIDEMDHFDSKYTKVVVNLTKKSHEEKINILVQTEVGSNGPFDKKMFFLYFILLKDFESTLPKNPDLSYITKCIFLKEHICAYEDAFEDHAIAKDLDMSHLKVALQAVSKWHAVSLAFENCKSQETAYKITDDYGICLQESAFFREELSEGEWRFQILSSTIRGVCFLLDTTNSSTHQLKEKITQYLEEFLDLMNNESEYKKVCCHGSLRKSNILFKYQNEAPISCKFVNFQLVRYAPPIFDALYLINLSNSRDAHRHLEELIDFYRDSLRNELKTEYGLNLNDIITPEEFAVTCKIYKKATKFLRIILEMCELFKSAETGQSNVFLMAKMWASKENADKMSKINERLKRLEDLLDDNVVDPEYIHTAVKNKLNSDSFTIISKALTRLSIGSGFLSDHYYLKVKVETSRKQEEIRLFAKLLPTQDALKAIVIDMGVFFKESRLFQRIIPDFQKVGIHLLDNIMPECYFSNWDVILFEDVSVKGFKPLNNRLSLSLEAVKLATSAIAKLHASVFIYEEMKSGESPYRIVDEHPREFEEAFFANLPSMVSSMEAAKRGVKSQLRIFDEDLGDIDLDDFEKWVLNQIDGIFDWVKPSKKYRNTMGHGDLWPNNFLFKVEDGREIDLKIVDFQSYRYTSPAKDLLCFIHLSTNRAFRKEHDVRDFYYEELKKNLKEFDLDIEEIVPYIDFLDDLEEAKPYCISHDCLWNHATRQNSEQLKEFYAAHADKFVNEDRSGWITELCLRDPVYKEIQREAILDFKDLYLQTKLRATKEKFVTENDEPGTKNEEFQSKN